MKRKGNSQLASKRAFTGSLRAISKNYVYNPKKEEELKKWYTWYNSCTGHYYRYKKLDPDILVHWMSHKSCKYVTTIAYKHFINGNPKEALQWLLTALKEYYIKQRLKFPNNNCRVMKLKLMIIRLAEYMATEYNMRIIL